MSRVNDLLRQLERENPGLAKDLGEEFDALANRRAFGLNFERHVPEAVELPGRKVRKGDKVRILPPRGEKRTKDNDRLFRVAGFEKGSQPRTANLVALADTDEVASAAAEDLVVVAEFRDPIYPGLVSTGKIKRGGDKPFHTVINAENFHALQTLLFTHRGKVDCIYIDPPYNTGAKDWKYNNNYVESDDHYRHSKWLAFMERRLRAARPLLKPDSALVVTIDEHEVHTLGMLLEQVFPDAEITMVTIVINPKGVTRGGFSRVEEYAFFCLFGSATARSWSLDDLLTLGADDLERSDEAKGQVARPRWKGLLRSGSAARRQDRPNMFYPVLVDQRRSAVVGVGDVLPLGEEPDFGKTDDGLSRAWPVRTGRGKEPELGRWGVGPDTLRELISQGYVALGKHDQARNTWALSYLSKGPLEQLAAGILVVDHYDEVRNLADVVFANSEDETRRVKTVWHRTRHDAGAGGSDLVTQLIGPEKFTFPKSVHAVRDTLKLLTNENDRAVIVDFFAGSGTTAHATMMLNAEDGGRRQTISVTNNEVSAEKKRELQTELLRAGDTAWEEHGIFHSSTVPRILNAVQGTDVAGSPLPDTMRNPDGSLASNGFKENVKFLTLTYEAPLRVTSSRAFLAIAPLLWLCAGSSGPRIDDVSNGWAVSGRYGVINDLDKVDIFLETIASNPSVSTAFVVTDEDRLFEAIVSELPDSVEPVRLYESYLRNFEIEAGRSVR